MRALAAALALPCLLGCAQIAGTAEYEVAAKPKKEVPLPFLTGSEECKACAADRCGDQLTACDASELCSSWLADIRERPNPAGAYHRFRIEADVYWQYQHEGQPFDSSITNLRSCAQKCLEPCKIGQNFSCVGDFEWDLPRPTVLRTRIGLNELPVSAEVRACLNADQCEVPLASGHTDGAGFADLQFDSDADARGSINYLHFKRENALPWQWVQTRPFAENDYITLDLVDDARFRQWHEAFGQSFAGARGVLAVTPADCSGMNAKQVTLEAWQYAGNDLIFCEDCFYAYAEDLTGAPNAEVEAFLTTGRIGYIANVPPGLVYVLLRRLAEPRDVVSVAHLVVRAGEVAIVRAHPASKQDLMSFSGAKN